MSFSNRIFDVNGRTDEDLYAALKLAFSLSGHNTGCVGVSKSKVGLLLHWSRGDNAPG